MLFAQLLSPKYGRELEGYLLNHTFELNGRFYYIQQEGGTPQWILEVLTPKGEIGGYYLLLGRSPTPANPFGWARIDIDVAKLKEIEPTGYFVQIDYPKDPSQAFSWVYIDRASGKIYKLVDFEEGNFRYFGPLKLHVALFGQEVLFFKRGDRLTYDLGSHIELLRYGKSQGPILFDPRYLKSGKDFYLLEDRNLTSIRIFQRALGRAGESRVEGSIEKLPLQGIVRIKSRVGKFVVDCTEYYKPLELDSLQKGDGIDKIFQEWGEGGVCSRELVRTTCPKEYYKELVGCGRKFDLSSLSQNVDFATLTRYSLDDNVSVTVYERIRVDSERGD
ncbi:MAG: hypothetical protein C6I00_01505 [Nitratiruptor sp.]|nr:hypothetical protein [Nitratiruptor sp.]